MLLNQQAIFGLGGAYFHLMRDYFTPTRQTFSGTLEETGENKGWNLDRMTRRALLNRNTLPTLWPQRPPHPRLTSLASILIPYLFVFLAVWAFPSSPAVLFFDGSVSLCLPYLTFGSTASLTPRQTLWPHFAAMFQRHRGWERHGNEWNKITSRRNVEELL